mgnify:CR=1 FL=1
MRSFLITLMIALVLALVPAVAGQDASLPDASSLRLVEIASGFTRPLYLTHAGDGSERLFVVEQGGRIWVIENGQRLETPFLDVSSLVSPSALGSDYSEQGLLGLAFHPSYAENGRFYINYTDRDGNTVVAQLNVSTDPNMGDPTSLQPILNIPQPYGNHNGGNMAFSPDGYLYIGVGDGGSQGDPQGNGQRLDTLLGKLLRIDVNVEQGYSIPADNPFVGQSDVQPEIWAYGLRNPWRFSFDRATGDLYMGDVGASAWEEINFQPAASPGGANYGWSYLEANQARTGAVPSGLTAPILTYTRDEGFSVTGGYVYRGEQMPDLQGVYFYGDFGGTIWAARQGTDEQWETSRLMQYTGYTISSFGEDEAGELYVVNYAGTILKIESNTP